MFRSYNLEEYYSRFSIFVASLMLVLDCLKTNRHNLQLVWPKGKFCRCYGYASASLRCDDIVNDCISCLPVIHHCLKDSQLALACVIYGLYMLKQMRLDMYRSVHIPCEDDFTMICTQMLSHTVLHGFDCSSGSLFLRNFFDPLVQTNSKSFVFLTLNALRSFRCALWTIFSLYDLQDLGQISFVGRSPNTWL